MEDKQGLYQRSRELKDRGWIPAELAPSASGGDKPEIKRKEEPVVMIDTKLKIPGAQEPSYLPPVVTLPAECACEDFLAMSTLRTQRFDKTYEPDHGIGRGTIFPDLDLPFMGEGGMHK